MEHYVHHFSCFAFCDCCLVFTDLEHLLQHLFAPIRVLFVSDSVYVRRVLPSMLDFSNDIK